MADDQTNQEILELSTAPRRKVSIDGVAYDLVSPAELTILQTHRIQKLLERLQAKIAGFAAHDAPGDGEDCAAEADAVLVQAMAVILPSAPPEVLNKLSPGQQLEIARFFSVGKARTDESAQPAGKSSSPDSSGSTGLETLATG